MLLKIRFEVRVDYQCIVNVVTTVHTGELVFGVWFVRGYIWQKEKSSHIFWPHISKWLPVSLSYVWVC